MRRNSLRAFTRGPTSRRGGPWPSRGSTSGFSLVEVLVAVTMLSIGLLGLAHAGFLTSQTLRSGRSFIAQWTVAQGKLDSLASLGWDALDGERGSENAGGQQVRWIVQGTDPRKIILVVERRVLATVSVDTFTTYIAKRE